MGQSTSRSSRPTSSSTSSPPRDVDAAQAGASSSTTSVRGAASSSNNTHSASAANKSSRRRSLLKLVSRSSSHSSSSPSSSSANTDNNNSSSSSSSNDSDDSSRRRHLTLMPKRWRSPRRFSRTPSQLHGRKEPHGESSVPQGAQDHNHPDLPQPPPVETQIIDGPLCPSGPSSTTWSRPATPPIYSPSEASGSHLPSPPHEELPLPNQNMETWPSESPPTISTRIPEPEEVVPPPPLPNTADIEREINELLSIPPEPTISDSGMSPNTAQDMPIEQESTSIQPPPRNFPPPGTVVVVQGVVNTTDAPPASGQRQAHNQSAPPPPAPDSSYLQPVSSMQRRSSSAPRSSHRSGNLSESTRRTGFSSLMSRPSSMISRRSSTSSGLSAIPAHRRSDSAPLSSESTPHLQEGSSSLDLSESSHSGDSEATTPAESEGHRALSPGSIDVLGTLLSVAAAATAASLFSPGLSGGAANNQSSGGRPTSPTPTASTGGFDELGRLAELSLDPSGANSRPPNLPTDGTQNDREPRDRIRNAWDSFRERLGLSSRGGSSSGHSTGGEGSETETSTTDPPPRMRPGELMLAEMARALHAGLGLNGTERSRSSGESTARSETERSSGSGLSLPTNGASRPLYPDPGFEAFLTSLQADLRTVLSGNSSPEDDASQSTVQSHTRASSDGPQHDADVPSDVLPFADDDTDSDLDSDAEDTNPPPMLLERPIHHPRTPTPIPSANLHTQVEPPDEHGEEEALPRGDRRQPAVNLWRVYRFSPIPAPPGHAIRTSVLPPPNGPVYGTSRTASSSSNAHAMSPDTSALESFASGSTTPAFVTPSTRDSEPTSTPTNNETPEDLNVVVPVIVVGLQSVDAPSEQDEALEDGSAATPVDDLHRHDETMTDLPEDLAAYDNAPGRPSTPRGRTWRSRAANALRGLRPGRRNGSGGHRESEATGSRTFLIYVIGGYYPPNHHVVTGSDNLDSYEALWELADLLGQVKPPVASREDIEKSGLEIIKASEMKHHERNGRIRANCMDRCLICLDDYEPEHDVRVMTCGHAFHKDCVDTWLQVGRNNCPACRTKGVSTSGDSTPISSPTVS